MHDSKYTAATIIAYTESDGVIVTNFVYNSTIMSSLQWNSSSLISWYSNIPHILTYSYISTDIFNTSQCLQWHRVSILASQIPGNATVCSTADSTQQYKHQIPTLRALCKGNPRMTGGSGDRWIVFSKGQLGGERVQLMTSSRRYLY